MIESPLSGEADTHARIIEAALKEFTQNGYKGASTRAIAERAGVNEVTLFRHFGSKLDLLRIAVQHAVRAMEIPEAVDQYLTMSFRSGFAAFVTEHLLQVTQHSDILMLGFAESHSHPEIAEPLMQVSWQIRKRLLQYFAALQEQGRMRSADTQIVAQIVMVTLHSTLAMRRRAPVEITQHLTNERIAAALVETIVSAYGTETAAT